MKLRPIDDASFLLMAMHHYDNPQCTSIGEFEEDLKRFSYLKKLFGRYKDGGELRERLIINHLTILHNVFGVVLIEMLFFKIDQQHWDVLATFLDYLGLMPDEVPDFGIKAHHIMLDQHALKVLEKL